MIARIRRLRTRRLRARLRDEEEFYRSGPRAPGRILAWQLERFNARWREAVEHVPYYRRLRHERDLPGTFLSWREVRERLPVLERGTLQARTEELVSEARPPSGVRTTSGTTGRPLRVPVCRSEVRVAAASMWHARSRFGIEPHDRAVLLWGRAHALGRGWRRALRRLSRAAKDRLLGYRRISAYDLSEEAMRRAGEEVLAHRPRWMLGYAGALLRFAEANRSRADAFRELGLAAAIATAESFPRPDGARAVEEVVGCPVPMEYGSVETGPVAHETPEGGFAVLWRRYHVELGEPSVSGAPRPILLTSLHPRSVPLFRYRVGDLARAGSEGPSTSPTDGVARLREVVGRADDAVVLADGTPIHSEAFGHAVKEAAGIRDFQVVQEPDARIRLRYVAAPRCSGGTPELEVIRERLASVHPDLGSVAFRRLDALPKTPAGKIRRVVRRRGGPE